MDSGVDSEVGFENVNFSLVFQGFWARQAAGTATGTARAQAPAQPPDPPGEDSGVLFST